MRALFNILAVVVGVAGGLLAWRFFRATVDTLVWLWDGRLQADYLFGDIIFISLLVGTMALCLWVCWRALRHLRAPSPDSRRAMVTMGCWLLVFLFVLPITKHSWLWILLLFGLYYLRRYLLRQITQRDAGINRPEPSAISC